MITLQAVCHTADIDRVADLAEACWNAHYTAIIGAAQVRYMLDRFQSPAAIREQIAQGRIYQMILTTDPAPHGYLAYDLHADHLFLSKLYILPTSQRRGHAREALELLRRERPGLEIRLTVNKHNAQAIAFYEAAGFRKHVAVIADIGNGFVMDDWEMRSQ